MSERQQFRIATEHHRAGRLQDAEAIYRSIVKSNPNHPESLHGLGLIAARAGRLADATALVGRAAALVPSNAEYQVNLGVLHLQQDRRDDASICFDRALALAPKDLESLIALGAALKVMGRIDDAIRCCDGILQIKPDLPTAHANRGIALGEVRRFDEAIASLRRAIELRPDYLEAISALAITLAERGNCDEAIEWHSRAASLQPASPVHVANIGNVLVAQGKVHEAIALYRGAIARGVSNAALHANLLLALNFDERCTPAEISDEHRRWASTYQRAQLAQPPSNNRDPERPLRVAYHAVFDWTTPTVILLKRALAAHDRDAAEMVLYHESTKSTPALEWLATDAVGSRLTLAMSDDSFVEMIRKDRIDVFVDLCGHTANSRLVALSRKPAPVQMTYLGYCNTTGLASMDYMISDGVVDPPEFEARYSEKLLRLPGGFTCFSPPDDAPAVSALPALQHGTVTLGSTHALAKLNRQMIKLWSRVLRHVSQSRLLIVRHTLMGSAVDRLRNWFREEQIDPARVEFRSQFPSDGHLSLYNEIDICLDVQPWSGHVTACQAMWMGVPMITMLGTTHAGRMVASVLHQLGRTQWIASDEDQYVELVKRLAQDIPVLASIRAELRSQIEGSSLCDGRRLAMELEQGYRAAWRRWCVSGK